jgi:uncharacterized protein (DUF488 family)
MNRIYTIGFTKKSAQEFFNLLEQNNVEIVVDIRLNNTSQLAAFAKHPDIQYFLKVISNIKYIHDKSFAPAESTLAKYKKKIIHWDEYVIEFKDTMKKRNIEEHIKSNYLTYNNVCLLCSESSNENCHRSIVSEIFSKQFGDLDIINL